MRLHGGIRKVGRKIRERFAGKHIAWLPGVAALRGYDRALLRADSRAALNVTLLAVAQAVAFAAIAGLPVVYGVLGTAVAALVAPWFAASRHTILGPTNATAFMLFSFFASNPALRERTGELVPLLVLMVGVAATVGAVVRAADLMQFVSRSVLVGYISGAAVLIIANQSVHLLGLGARIEAGSAASFAGLVVALVKALPHVHWVSLGMGAVAAIGYAALLKWKPHWPVFAISLAFAALVFGPLIRHGVPPFAGVETFHGFGLAELMPGPPHLIRADVFDDIYMLLGVAFAIAFVASLENTLMAKSLASRSGDHADVNQDMFSVGMSNLASAVAGGMPASGSLTRSTLNFESGALTRFASFFAGLFSLAFAVAVAAATDAGVAVIDHIPKAALAALVIAISLPLLNLRNIRICLHSTGDDAVVLVTTFVATLLAPLHVAIFIGVAVSISLFLRQASRPHLVEYEFSDDGALREVGEKRGRPIPAVSIVHVEGELFFGAAELFRTQIQRTVSDPAIRVIILRLKNACHLDATSVMALEDLIRHMRAKGLHLIVSGASRDVYRVLKRSGVLETLQEGCDRRAGETNLFLSNPHNPNLSTRDALLRAKELIGTDKADVRIFYDPAREGPRA